MTLRRTILFFALPLLLLSGCAKEQSSPTSADSTKGTAAAPKPKPRFPAGGRRPGFPSPSAAQGQGGNAAGQTPVSPAPAA